MPLYIGQNHGKESASVQSIFRLNGDDEDALTYALGFLLAHDNEFCDKFVRRLKLAPRQPIWRDYLVRLQEVTGRGYGRRDIAIESGGTRIVLEAKIGRAEPTAEQLLKYGAEQDLWKDFKTRRVASLTQVELSSAVREEVRSGLAKHGIQFSSVQWHEVIDLALRHRPTDGSDVSRYLFNEFARFIRSDYQMKYYDAEVAIQDVNLLNAKIFEKGWVYAASPRDKSAPLYFAPYFTKENPISGITKMSRVLHTEVVVLANDPDAYSDQAREERNRKWERGIQMLKKRAKKQGWDKGQTRLFYLDEPMVIATTPITKRTFKGTNCRKSIPNQIPPGFNLRFDELLRHGLGFGSS